VPSAARLPLHQILKIKIPQHLQAWYQAEAQRDEGEDGGGGTTWLESGTVTATADVCTIIAEECLVLCADAMFCTAVVIAGEGCGRSGRITILRFSRAAAGVFKTIVNGAGTGFSGSPGMGV
jgi:hypothetical protein